jgi:penicillin-binding protein 1A
MNNYLYQEILRVEDRDFKTHWGISIKGIVRALITNIKALRIKQGGSTITQQLIKMNFPVKNRWIRKFVELLIAPLLTIFLGRDKIFNKYINNVYFGKNIYGINDAATHYFNKYPIDLRQEECLILACMLSRPYYWINNIESLKHKVRYFVNRDYLRISWSMLDKAFRQLTQCVKRDL